MTVSGLRHEGRQGDMEARETRLTSELLVNGVSLLNIFFQIVDRLSTEFQFDSFILVIRQKEMEGRVR
jgi:hypothetical protein